VDFKMNAERVRAHPSRNLTAKWKRDLSLPFLYKHAVRGRAVNDVIVLGSCRILTGSADATIMEAIYLLPAQLTVALPFMIISLCRLVITINAMALLLWEGETKGKISERGW
jgi:hypothetical protein